MKRINGPSYLQSPLTNRPVRSGAERAYIFAVKMSMSLLIKLWKML